VSVLTDPAPVLEASHTLEERLQHLHSSAPDSEALVREISGHWKKHLEYLEKTGQAKNQVPLECNFYFNAALKQLLPVQKVLGI